VRKRRDTGEGNTNYYVHPKVTTTTSRKKRSFFSGHYCHINEDAAGKFEAFSSACQIGNERLMKNVQPVPQHKAELNFHATFFKSSIILFINYINLVTLNI
jgi:hypothetical protein